MGTCSSMRRRMMMSAKEQEPIVWDYEWYPPEEKPAWLTTQVAGTMGENYYRVPVYNGGSIPNKNFITFSSSVFPSGKSYIIEIDVEEMTIRAQSNSVQSAIHFFDNASGVPRITRYGQGKISGTNYYYLGLNTADNANSTLITNNLRFKIHIECDTVAPLFTLKVNNIALSTAKSVLPRIIRTRYIKNGGYWDIYSIKVKVIDNE